MFIIDGAPADGPALDAAAYYAVQAAEFAASDCRCAKCGGPIERISDSDVGPNARYLLHRAGTCRAGGMVA